MHRKCYPGLWEGVIYRRKKNAERMSKNNKERLIEESKERLEARTPMLKGDNFYFVCWGDITELKLWDRP